MKASYKLGDALKKVKKIKVKVVKAAVAKKVVKKPKVAGEKKGVYLASVTRWI